MKMSYVIVAFWWVGWSRVLWFVRRVFRLVGRWRIRRFVWSRVWWSVTWCWILRLVRCCRIVWWLVSLSCYHSDQYGENENLERIERKMMVFSRQLKMKPYFHVVLVVVLELDATDVFPFDHSVFLYCFLVDSASRLSSAVRRICHQ